MIDDLLAAGSAFDWISPFVGYVKDVLNGPFHTFLIPYSGGWTGREISNLLGKRGVKSWGYMVVDGTLMLSVTEQQAQWAQHLLDTAGIPVETCAPEKQQQEQGWFDRLWR